MPSEGIAIAGMPRARAVSRPGADARLEMTTAMSASMRPAATLSAMAAKFDPRPESRIPRRGLLIGLIHNLFIYNAVSAALDLGDSADAEERFASAPQCLGSHRFLACAHSN